MVSFIGHLVTHVVATKAVVGVHVPSHRSIELHADGTVAALLALVHWYPLEVEECTPPVLEVKVAGAMSRKHRR